MYELVFNTDDQSPPSHLRAPCKSITSHWRQSQTQISPHKSPKLYRRSTETSTCRCEAQTTTSINQPAHHRKGCLQGDESTATALLNMCKAAGDVENAEKAWGWCSKLAGQPSVYLYNIMIHTMERTGQHARALQLFKQMQSEGVPDNAVTYADMVATHAARGDWKKHKTTFKVCA